MHHCIALLSVMDNSDFGEEGEGEVQQSRWEGTYPLLLTVTSVTGFPHERINVVIPVTQRGSTSSGCSFSFLSPR